MNACVVGGHKLELYSSIDEMPMANYHKFNKYLMFESGLAPDANGVIGHLSKMNELLAAGEYEKLGVELQNTYQSVYYIMEGLSPVSMAFACMVYKIDGKEMTDLSDDSLKRLSGQLNREKASVIRSKVDELKKKTEFELGAYFKKAFSDNAKTRTADLLAKRRLDFLIGLLRSGKPYHADEDSNRWKLAKMYRPTPMLGSNSVEIEYDKQYERIKLIIAQKTNLDIKSLTVFQYYTYLEAVKEQVDEEQKAAKRIKK